MFGLGGKSGRPKADAYKLPNWAEWREDGCVMIDPHKAYPLYLAALGVIADASDPFRRKEVITQYWLEVAQRCIIEDLRRWAIVHGATGLHNAWRRDPRWAFRQFALVVNKTSGGNSADRGRAEFRQHYNRIRQLQSNGNRALSIPKWGGGTLTYKEGFEE